MMLEELERRNYSQSTVRAYVRTIRDLARYFNRPPDQLGPEQLGQYQAYLFRECKLAPNTVNQRTAARRFFW
jgi:site-specific recombinase XerD